MSVVVTSANGRPGSRRAEDLLDRGVAAAEIVAIDRQVERPSHLVTSIVTAETNAMRSRPSTTRARKEPSHVES